MDSTPKHPKNQVRKPNFSEYNTSKDPSLTGNGIVSVHDPHSGGIGHSRHARLLSLLLVSVDNEQSQEEEDHQDEDDDASNGPDLVGVSGKSRAGSA